MRRRFQFWSVYAIAWLPLVTTYAMFFTRHLGRTLSDAIKTSILGVLPVALLGVGVVDEAYRIGDTLVFIWEHQIHNVSLNGIPQSENPKIKEILSRIQE
jgi:hypothetical protein